MECGIAIYTAEDLKLTESFKNFSIVEIPGEILETDDFDGIMPQKNVIHIRELLGRNIISELPEVPFQVRCGFLTLLDKRCKLMQRCGIRIATLTPDIGRAISDKNYQAALKDILLCISGICRKYDIELCYELRLPENFEQALDVTGRFLSSTSLFFKLLLDFHPHEPRSFDYLTAVAGKLPFNCDNWRISFEVASCNYLSAEVVKRVMKLSRRSGWANDYMIFAPGVGTDSENYLLLDKLAGECCKKG